MDLNPLEQLDVVVSVGAILLVLVTYFVLRRVFVAPYLRVMEERARLFDSAEAQISEAARIADESEAQAAEALARAQESAEEMVAEARTRADATRRQTVEAATVSASERLESGRAALAQVHRAELEELRGQAVECVMTACGRLLPDVDGDIVEAAVDRVIARRMT